MKQYKNVNKCVYCRSDAERCKQHFHENNPLGISIDFAKVRETPQAPIAFDLLDYSPATEEKPFRNRLELSKRYGM